MPKGRRWVIEDKWVSISESCATRDENEGRTEISVSQWVCLSVCQSCVVKEAVTYSSSLHRSTKTSINEGLNNKVVINDAY